MICRTLERELHARLLLIDQLADTLAAREVARADDLREKLKQTRQILTQHLGAQLEARHE